MDVEHDIKTFPIDENLDAEIKKLMAEGWELMPGVKPVAVYHVVRLKNRPPASAAIGEMRIDESKVFVIPAGTKQ
jgi:hypothetical protein